MIIERKYVSFYSLSLKDPKSKEIFEGHLNKYLDAEEAERIIEHNYSYRTMLYNADIGYGIPEIYEIAEAFKKLDKEYPFDNGYTLADVNEIEIIDKDEKQIKLLLKNKFYGEEEIVCFKTIKAKK